MSDASWLPTDIEVGDSYALRTFDVKDGRLASIAQGGGHWQDGRCLAICLVHPEDPDHKVPTDGCKCGVYAFWTIGELTRQYEAYACRIVAVIRMEGECIDGDNGVQANAAEIVAWWCADSRETAELATACAASAPGTRRYFDRDVMLGLYPAPQKPEEPEKGEPRWVTSGNRGAES